MSGQQMTFALSREEKLALLERAEFTLSGRRGLECVNRLLETIEKSVDRDGRVKMDVLCGKLRKARSTVTNWINYAVALKVLTVEKYIRDGGQGSNSYQVNWDRVRRFVSGSPAKVCDPVSGERSPESGGRPPEIGERPPIFGGRSPKIGGRSDADFSPVEYGIPIEGGAIKPSIEPKEIKPPPPSKPTIQQPATQRSEWIGVNIEMRHINTGPGNLELFRSAVDRGYLEDEDVGECVAFLHWVSRQPRSVIKSPPGFVHSMLTSRDRTLWACRAEDCDREIARKFEEKYQDQLCYVW